MDRRGRSARGLPRVHIILMKTYTIQAGPQPGPQRKFLATPADIAIYGGGAYGGKTMALLLEPLRHLDNPKFVIKPLYVEAPNDRP